MNMAMTVDILWQTFVEKSQELFSFGYNLPIGLQIRAVQDVRTKTIDWEKLLNVSPVFQRDNAQLRTEHAQSDISDTFADAREGESAPLASESFDHVAGSRVQEVPMQMCANADPENEHPNDNVESINVEPSDVLRYERVLPNTIKQETNILSDCVTSWSESDSHTDKETRNIETPINVETRVIISASPRRSSRKKKFNSKFSIFATDFSPNHEPEDDFPNIVLESMNETDSDKINKEVESVLHNEPSLELISYEDEDYNNGNQEELNEILMKSENPDVISGKRTRGRPKKMHTIIESLFSELDLKYKCNRCSKKYGSEEVFNSHMRSHDSKMPLVCSICNKQYTSKSGFDNHIRTHDPTNNIQCPYCDFKCTNYTVMNRHVVLRHENKGERPYLCDLCGKGFLQPSTLKLHMLSHDGIKKYACDLCSFRTHTKNILGIHRRNMHVERKYFSCDLCDAKIKYKSSLQEHRLRHLGEKPHSCGKCGLKFTTRSQLAQHVRIHNDRNHECEICHKRFINRHKLARHATIHSGEKKYACGFCNYRCNVRGNIRKHWLGVHKMDHDRRMARVKVINGNEKEATDNHNTDVSSMENAIDNIPKRIPKSRRTHLNSTPKVSNDEINDSTGDNALVSKLNNNVSVLIEDINKSGGDATSNSVPVVVKHDFLPSGYTIIPSADNFKKQNLTSNIVDVTVNSTAQVVDIPVSVPHTSVKVVEMPAMMSSSSATLSALSQLVQRENPPPVGVNIQTKVEIADDGTQMVYLYFHDDMEHCTLLTHGGTPQASGEEYVVTMDHSQI